MSWLLTIWRFLKNNPLWGLIGALALALMGERARRSWQARSETRQQAKTLKTTLGTNAAKMEELETGQKATERDYIESAEKDRQLAEQDDAILAERERIAQKWKKP